MNYEFHEEARREFLNAGHYYYENASPSVVSAFFHQVYSTIQLIQHNPQLFPRLKDDIHRAPVRNFPYSIIYTITPDRVYIVAVAHAKRKPEYWTKRKRG